MKGDWGNYIYYIGIGIYVLYQIFGKKKKQKSESNVPKQKPIKNWEDILNETLNIPQTKPKKVIVQPIEKTKKEHHIPKPLEGHRSVTETIYHSHLHKEKVKPSKTSIQEKLDKVNLKTSTLQENTNSFEFDAKKAIIYSEIMKSPEY